MNWYLKALSQYVDFSGRARRKEYWFFSLFNIIFLIITAIIDNMIGTFNQENGIGLISGSGNDNSRNCSNCEKAS